MNRRSRKLPLLGPETLALLMTFLIGGWGLLTIVSSQSHASEPFLLAGKQLMFLILGLAVMWGAAKVPFRFYCRNAWILMLAAFGLLLLLPLFGVRVNGMCGWFRLGGFHFQPTEPAKGIYLLTLVIAVTIGNIIGLIPLFPAGVGGRDVATVTILVAGSVAVGDAKTGQLLYTAIVLFFNLIGGLFFILDPGRRNTEQLLEEELEA